MKNYETYFTSFSTVSQKKYEALRCFYLEKKNAQEVADKFGYTIGSFYALINEFKQHIKDNPETNYFFLEKKTGRKRDSKLNKTDEQIIALRKKSFSIPEIKSILDTQSITVSESYCYDVLRKDGFGRLPRRKKVDKVYIPVKEIAAPKSSPIGHEDDEFSSSGAGILLFLPYIKKLGIDKIIKESSYPESRNISRLSSILAFLALKLSNIRRYSTDDVWCMDRGTGLFAGLNVLPKSSWYTSYAYGVQKSDNLSFLRQLHKLWQRENLLSDTANLDFTTIPYWGEDDHLENNWSGKRNKALSSMLAILAHDPETGILSYGNTDVKHENESREVLEFLDFYQKNSETECQLKYLVFDSKFTSYENLGRLDEKGIKFITIRRRGKNIIEKINSIPDSHRKKVVVERAGNKKQTIYAYEERIVLEGYNLKSVSKEERKMIRQIAITGHGKIKPALIITNDFDLSIENIVRKYCRRWLVEKQISQQIDFFHLNRVSSSIVIKVDFDLTMTILAHNLYRVFAQDLERYNNISDIRIFEKFIANSGKITISKSDINIELKKKRHLPIVLSNFDQFKNYTYSFLKNKNISFSISNST